MLLFKYVYLPKKRVGIRRRGVLTEVAMFFSQCCCVTRRRSIDGAVDTRYGAGLAGRRFASVSVFVSLGFAVFVKASKLPIYMLMFVHNLTVYHVVTSLFK